MRSPSTLQTTATRRPSTSAKRNGSPIATETSCRSSVERTESPIMQHVRHRRKPTHARCNASANVPSVSSPLDELRVRLAEGADLRRAAGVLGWEQRVTMPPRGTDARADQLATLGRIAHERFIDDEVGRLLDAAEPLVESLPYDSDDRSLVRVTRRDWEKARRVPTALREEMTRAGARAATTPGSRRAGRTTSRRSSRTCARTSSSSAATSSASSGRTARTRRCSTTTSRGC